MSNDQVLDQIEQMPVAKGVTRCLGCELFFLSGVLMATQPVVVRVGSLDVIDGKLFSHGYCATCADNFRSQYGLQG